MSSLLPVIGAGISGIGSIFGGGKAASAATDAAQIQADAASKAADAQLQMFHETQANLAPFMAGGQVAFQNLLDLTGSGAAGSGGQGPLVAPLTAPLTIPSFSFNPDMATLAQTPGYQFTRTQGLQAVQNQLASQGLGRSGSAVKGAANYAEGLAGTTYQQQFNNAFQTWQSQMQGVQLGLGQRQQIYNMIAGPAASGQAAAAQTGGLGLQATTQAGNFLTSGAAAQAAGIVGSTNALNAGLTGATGAAGNAALLYALTQPGMYGAGAGQTYASGQPGSGTGGLY